MPFIQLKANVNGLLCLTTLKCVNIISYSQVASSEVKWRIYSGIICGQNVNPTLINAEAAGVADPMPEKIQDRFGRRGWPSGSSVIIPSRAE